MSDELKPCPTCGGQPELVKLSDGNNEDARFFVRSVDDYAVKCCNHFVLDGEAGWNRFIVIQEQEKKFAEKEKKDKEKEKAKKAAAKKAPAKKAKTEESGS